MSAGFASLGCEFLEHYARARTDGITPAVNRYPQSIVSGCNGIRNCFHGCTCQRRAQPVRLFRYQCIRQRFCPYVGSRGNGIGLSFPYTVLICIYGYSLFWLCVTSVTGVTGCYRCYSPLQSFKILLTFMCEIFNSVPISLRLRPCWFNSNTLPEIFSRS